MDKFKNKTFEEKLLERYGKDSYDLSMMDYKDSKTPIVVICNFCKTERHIPPADLLRRPCKCLKSKTSRFSSKKVDVETFIERCLKIHISGEYDYTETRKTYKGLTEKCKIRCNTCGNIFEQLAKNHLNGARCKCHTRLSLEQFLERAKTKHNDVYDYSLVEYINSYTKVKIRCPTHEYVFEQTPSFHLYGYGCKFCGIDKNTKRDTFNIIKFIEMGEKAHGNFYDYSRFVYVNSSTKGEIICPIHGSFMQQPSVHWNGSGCPKCSIKRNSENRTKSTEQFIDECIQKFGNIYDYSKVDYKASDEKIIIICKIHGEFYQTPNSHLCGIGCPACGKSLSKGEIAICELLKNNRVLYEQRVRTIVPPKEIDIFIPEYSFAIEYDGVYWHSELNGKDKKYHLGKTKGCESMGIKLFHIFDTEWNQKSDIVKSMICNNLNIYKNKIHARKCDIVKDLSVTNYREFCDLNHIQGYANSIVRYGLEYSGELIAVIGFRKNKKYGWEMARYCSKISTKLYGGLTKLWSVFKLEYSPDRCVSYADRRYFTGESYKHCGFKFSHNSAPNYFYFRSDDCESLASRIKFQKHKLPKKLDKYDSKLSEWENMKANGYDRIWDCGNSVWVYTKI